MKTQLIIAALLIATALTQGYVAGGANSISLPTVPRSGSDSGSWSTSSSTVSVPIFPSAELSKLTGGTTNAAATAANIANTIKNAQTQLSTAVRSMESLFSRFPSKAELDKFADDGDTAAILKTINTVASDDSVPCSTKISYLLELLGSVKAAIQRKSLFVDQLVSIIDGAKAEITRLQAEIVRVQRDRDGLHIPDIERKIADLVSRLEVLYNQINALKTQIPPEEARILGYEKEIATYNKQNDDERNRISNDKLKLAQTISSIVEAENRLKDLRDARVALENSISNSEGLIRDNNAKINNLRNSVADISAKIKNLQDSIDRIKRDSNTLEVDLERSRTDLSVAQVKDKKLADDIKGFKDRIVAEQAKVVEDDLQKLRTIVDKLGKSYPTIQAGIDREYYYCYGPGKVQVETTGNTIVYIVNGDAFGQYIDNAYGTVSTGLRVSTSGNVRLQSVDAFSPVWTAKFGGSAKGGSGAASGRGNFSCWSSNATNGRGVITGVNADGIQINDANGRPVSLNIGACSRVESTLSLPKAGQNIAWRGATSSNSGSYDLISATCW